MVSFVCRSQHSDTVCSSRSSKWHRCRRSKSTCPGKVYWPVRFADHPRLSADDHPCDLFHEQQPDQPWSVPESACARIVPAPKRYGRLTRLMALLCQWRHRRRTGSRHFFHATDRSASGGVAPTVPVDPVARQAGRLHLEADRGKYQVLAVDVLRPMPCR
jgi:hypothetical protein